MSILQPFEEYQKARVKFVQAVADASTRPQNIEVMNNAGVMQLLRPLLLDNVSIASNDMIVRESLMLTVCMCRCQVFSRLLH
jgi:hypothetical protein